MKLKQSLTLISMALLTFMSASSHAGRQGVSFYYGLGLGITAPANSDIAATGKIMIGIEEDGWALEALAFNSVETGTDVPNLDYSVNGTELGLAYRTIERNKNWFKFKASSTKMTFDTSTNPNDIDTNGTSFTFGWGQRMDLDARLEIDYTYYDTTDLSDSVHMITALYFWGGPK